MSCVNTFAYDLSAYLVNIPVSNGYPFSFLQKRTKSGKPNNSAEPANEFKATAVLPYVKGLSEQLRRCLQQQGVRAVFKSETTLRSQLVRPKDAVDPAKQDGAWPVDLIAWRRLAIRSRNVVIYITRDYIVR